MKPNTLTTLLLLVGTLISGCSGSSDSTPIDPQEPGTLESFDQTNSDSDNAETNNLSTDSSSTDIPGTDIPGTDISSSDTVIPATVNADTINSNTVDSNTIDSNTIESGTAATSSPSPLLPETDNTVIPTAETDTVLNDDSSESQLENTNNTTSAADPLIQNGLLVTIDITVPAYQSNELRVALAWGNDNFTAMWVGDELWTASRELPTNTEHNLIVTFYDNNGDTPLAQSTQALATGSNAMTPVTISADQFSSDQFDNDNDGTSNFDELLLGSDPWVDEDAQLDINNTFSLSSVMSVSQSFENRLSNERPIFETSESPEGARVWFNRNLTIDSDGNGTYTYREVFRPDVLSFKATRTTSENSVSWEGSRRLYDGDYVNLTEVTNSVRIIDDTTREFVETVTGSHSGTYKDTWDVNSSLIGTVVEGTTLCQPVAGTVTRTDWSNRAGFGAPTQYTTTVTKEIDDPYWRVTKEYPQSETVEYFARELVILQSTVPDSQYFTCDFLDL